MENHRSLNRKNPRSMGAELPRSRSQRKIDALERLQRGVDLWGSPADETGGAVLVLLGRQLMEEGRRLE